MYLVVYVMLVSSAKGMQKSPGQWCRDCYMSSTQSLNYVASEADGRAAQ